ncbi:MAG: DOMON-like domain-containing protein [Halobacteriovoraceae bacterium]|jgi:hypothetical protein|nr:DOMON-like domain-containing protein [Halobacteriovoraceae bacterium]MBT5094927.1 DOMON-like domain-containing protein [Halobacteriovoraceae bacterium]
MEEHILQSFSKPSHRYTVSGGYHISHQQINFFFDLKGDLSQFSFERKNAPPTRRDQLWQDNCFEVFSLNSNTGEYLEFNLSPIGDWNVYHFTGQRMGMQTYTEIENLEIRSNEDSGHFHLEFDIPLEILLKGSDKLGLTAVIREKNSPKLEYWAKSHPSKKADFHDPKHYFDLAL